MGKNKYIETPEKMWEYFQSYIIDIRENPIYLIEQKKGNTSLKVTVEKGADMPILATNDIVQLPARRPLTLDGFENWCADEEIISDLGDYFANTDNKYSNYSTICSRIKRVIRQDQIEGGMVGIYNPSITQRLNGLVDRKETEIKGGLNIPNLPDIGNRK